MFRRSTACSTARSSALACTALRAPATSATSSWLFTVIGSISGITTSSPAGVSRIWRTAAGRLSPAMCSACTFSERSGRVIDRLASQVTTMARARVPPAIRMKRRWRAAASSRSDWAVSCRAAPARFRRPRYPLSGSLDTAASIVAMLSGSPAR